MASLPPQRQRRTSPSTGSADAAQSQAARSESFSAASVDSQTLLLNSPPPEPANATEIAQQEAPAQTASQPTESDNEPRTCWICFNDETEDDENTSEWRSPCPCVLVAHEQCLLDWVANMEAPSSRQRSGRTAGKITCPQCKSEIRLERPRSLVIELVRSFERTAKLAVIPGVASFASVATYATLLLFGNHTIQTVFGPADHAKIMRQLLDRQQVGGAATLVGSLNLWRTHWRFIAGVPAIPVTLILSRTRIADAFLPFLPLVFLASGSSGVQDSLLQFKWPPSAAFTVAVLPYVRSVYNSWYDRFCLPHERRWYKEVQPRTAADEQAEELEGAVHDAMEDELADDDDDDDDVVELEIDFDLLLENNNAQENPPVPIARGPAPPPEAPPADDEAPAAAEPNEQGDAAPAPNVPQQPAQPRRLRERQIEANLSITLLGVADTVLGALIFPSIAAAMGDALAYALPASWVTPAPGKPMGFLQAKWARSIVGGCLFVGLKDMVLLYVRWKMAQMHRNRRVLDYDGSKGKRKKKAT